ncbi:MAG: tetratricopeptide repeat protein [Coriobacteriia bacterium]|nr:tetratricopeptide repeat protein [Coriobacteriia bacterium]
MAASLSPRDQWLTWALRIVGVLVIGAFAFLAYTVFQGQRQADQSSIATRAVDSLEQAVRDDPESAETRILLGDAYRDTGRPADAIEQYDKALELSVDHPLALTGLALTAMQQEEWRTAEGYWQNAIEVMSKNEYASQDERLEKAYYYYGTVLIKLAEYEDAVAYLKEALRMNRSDADTHYALAVAYRELDSVSKQRESLETALLFVPTMPEANYDLGLLYLADGDEATAAELFRRSADNAPGREEPIDELMALGPFEDRMKKAESLADSDPGAALHQARIAAALDPTSIDAARQVARLLKTIGLSPDDEKAAWERVLDLVPEDQEAVEALAALGSDS